MYPHFFSLSAIILFSFTILTAQVKSTKTSIFIDLPPDRIDSLIADPELKRKYSERIIIFKEYDIMNIGFSVGTSFVDRQQVQLIGTVINFERSGENAYYMARYNRLYFENEGSFSTDIRQYLFGFGLHFRSDDIIDLFGAKIIAGAVHRLYPEKELWGAAGGLSFNYMKIFKTNFVSFLQVELFGIYSLDEPLIEGRVSYHFSPHKLVVCSFNFKHVEIPRIVSSDSFGFSVGLFFPDFTLMDNK